jgi:hypothetical protein
MSHQITNECVNNKKVELSEFIYISSKFERNIKTDCQFILKVNDLLKKYKIRNKNDLEDAELKSLIPTSILKMVHDRGKRFDFSLWFVKLKSMIAKI